jgi:hypothetical protein
MSAALYSANARGAFLADFRRSRAVEAIAGGAKAEELGSLPTQSFSQATTASKQTNRARRIAATSRPWESGRDNIARSASPLRTLRTLVARARAVAVSAVEYSLTASGGAAANLLHQQSDRVRFVKRAQLATAITLPRINGIEVDAAAQAMCLSDHRDDPTHVEVLKARSFSAS